MLGRKSYTRDELETGRFAIGRGIAAYSHLARAVAEAGDDGSKGAIADFEAHYFAGMVLVLDRLYVYRLRQVAGNDANPLNEVGILTESLMSNKGILSPGKVVKWVPDRTVLQLRPGDPIRLTAGDFERLSTAFFSELERRFVEVG